MVSVRDGLGGVVCQEVEIELGVWILQSLDYFHPEELVELD